MSSLITSRFEEGSISIGSNLSYNGGLIISFLTPLVVINIFMYYNHFLFLTYGLMITEAFIMGLGAFIYVKVVVILYIYV
jgi:hypothetical protein